MTMTHKEAEHAADLIIEVGKLAAQAVRFPEGHPHRPQYDELLAKKREELVEALRRA